MSSNQLLASVQDLGKVNMCNINFFYLRNLLIRLIIVFLLLPLLARPQPPRLLFRHITREQGLTNSTVEAIYQDSRGFIWFGTRDGLNRFDGYEIEVYRNDPKNPKTLSDNYISSIYEDKKHTLWIGTKNGLNKYDASKNSFVRYQHDDLDARTLSNNYINYLAGDSNGNLWICTNGGGLDKLNSNNGTFDHYIHVSSSNSSLKGNYVNSFFEDKTGNKWVGTNEGLDLINAKDKTFNLLKGEWLGRQKFGVVQQIKGDHKGNLWIGTENNGLVYLNYLQNKIKVYQHNERDLSSIAQNQIKSLLVDRKGNLWIGSIDGGLDLCLPNTNVFIHHRDDTDNSYNGLSQSTVSALFEDNQGNIWVGTHRGGINLYSPKADKFQLYRKGQGTNGLSNNDVTVLSESSSGDIWIGTDGGGINLFDRHSNNFKQYRHDPFNKNSLSADDILDIDLDNKGNLWIGTWGGGLDLFNPQTRKFKHFTHQQGDKNSISSDYVFKTFEDSKGNFWVATYYGGLNLLDRKTNKFTQFPSEEGNPGSLSGQNIVSMAEDKNDNLWIGTDDGGLNCYNLKTLRISHFFNTGQKIPDIRVIFVDSKGRVWVGQAGLYLFDSVRKSFSLFKDEAGLSKELIKGITEDEEGNFWISSTSGITKFNPETHAFRKYNSADGLQGLEFENAYLKTRTGEMFFGGVKGFNSFYPRDIKINRFIPPVYITGFQIFNKKAIQGTKDSPLSNDISLTKEISLSYKESTISFTFAALNFSASENNQYAYKLEKFDKDWNYIGTQRKASYTNLSPGEYTFRVKASNNDGIWNDTGASIRIIIQPPFWKTWWFLSLIAITIVATGYLFLRFKRNLELKELEERKREEIHQIQLQFFTNISHEFRTPLTLILGSLEKLLSESISESVTHYYNLIYRNSTRLMGLINELMDFRKVEEGVLKLKVTQGDLLSFVSEIAEEFEELAISKKIRFDVRTPRALPETWFDKQVLEKILLNVLHNSFKYTDYEGFVTLEILESIDNYRPSFLNEFNVINEYHAKSYIYIRVIDSGIGISKESIHHLFERYYRITESHLGSGVGLPFVKSLTLLHKGNIFVSSEREKGTEIIIGVPVNKDDYTNQERRVKTDVEGGVRLESIRYNVIHIPENDNHIPSEPVSLAKHILIVEDNEELRSFLKESLSTLYVISEAANGKLGFAKAKEERPDLIISDVMMPKLNGFEFCNLIKQDVDTNHIPFIMLTAKDTLESKIEGTASGADFYFEKPVSINLLLLTIRNVFIQKQKLKERYSNDYYSEARQLVHSTKDREFLEKLIHIIEGQLINPELDIVYLCLEIGMSRTKLYDKIKQITGQTIGEFIRTTRLKKAVQIMTHEDVPLTEVMFRVGIQTQSYFTKAFKKEFGKTPSQFLNELKN